MDEDQQTIIKQTTVILPFLEDEVPALILTDGKLYIPVFAVCHALGISADTHIRRWRHLLLWTTARKLPLQTQERGRRLVWCLLISEIPSLYGLFNWQLVPSERRLQLYHATKEQAKLLNLAYQNMQQQYKAMRQTLFTFLTRFVDIDTLLKLYTNILSPTLDEEASLRLITLVDRGRSLFQRTIEHARYMVHDQETLQIIDLFQIDANDKVIDSFSIPLLPIVSTEDREHFLALIEQLSDWILELQAFWDDRGNPAR
jgi:hypothetical protein